MYMTTNGWEAVPRGGSRAATPGSPRARLLRGQRDLPLPRPGLRRAPVRARGCARRGVAADRLRRGGVRGMEATLARGQPAHGAARAGAGADELLLLRGDLQAAARHGGGDRVP